MHVVLDSSYAVDSPWPLLSMKEAQREDVVVSRELEPLKNKLMFRHIIMLSWRNFGMTDHNSLSRAHAISHNVGYEQQKTHYLQTAFKRHIQSTL